MHGVASVTVGQVRGEWSKSGGTWVSCHICRHSLNFMSTKKKRRKL